jgi:hypothetical protein
MSRIRFHDLEFIPDALFSPQRRKERKVIQFVLKSPRNTGICHAGANLLANAALQNYQAHEQARSCNISGLGT